MKKIGRNILQFFGLMLILGFAVQAIAAVPAPPVNQELGFFDTRFNNLTAEECLICHNQNPPDGIPVDPTYLPDRHHLLMYQPINTPTVVPNPDSDGDTIPDTFYNCLNCHSETPGGEIIISRDCMDCHQQLGGDHHGYSPHHGTPLAQADLDNDGIRDTNAAGDPVTYCSQCHGSLVNDLGDGHYIPSYSPSLVTPWPSDKVNGDSSTVNSRGTQAGNCNFCHDSGTAEDGREVVDNLLSHHGAGFFFGYLGSGPCYWCHDPLPGGTGEPGDPTYPQAYSITTCEGCHGPDSLHNIQTDSGACSADGAPCYLDAQCAIGDTCVKDGEITIGGELAGFGHVGRDQGPDDSDCWGCHGFGIPIASAPFSGPIVPHVESFNPVVINAGEETSLAIHGLGFTNIVPGPTGPVTLSSVVKLESDDGTITTLVPDTITQSLINVTVPSSLGAGIYSLRVEKDYQYSNKATLLLQPQVKIDTALCEGNTVTINGDGFSGYVDAVNSGTGVTAVVSVTTGKGKKKVTTTSEVAGLVLSWNDSEIIAEFPSCGESYTVSSVFGDASYPANPPAGICSDYSDETNCIADPSCTWRINKKGRGSCQDAGGSGGGGGKPPKNR